MKKSLGALVLALLAAAVLTVPALADSGPKPQLTVQVVNAPAEPYYLELLEPGEAPHGGRESNLSGEDRAALDAAMVEALLAHVPENWHACLLEGTDAPMWGALTSGDSAGPNSYLHTFGYLGVPETYRVAIVTQSGDVRVFPPQTRQVLQSSVTVDFQGGGVKTPPVWIGLVLQFFATLLPTLAVEGAVLWLFGYKWKTCWKPFLWVNLITQGALAAYTCISMARHGFSFWWLGFGFIPAEIVIALAEIFLYRRYLTERGKAVAGGYALTANFASAVAGFFLAEPIWRFLMSISCF